MLRASHSQRHQPWGSKPILLSQPLQVGPRRVALVRPIGHHHTRSRTHVRAQADNDQGWLAPEKEKRLMGLMGSMFFEWACTGGLFWSPLLCALLFIVMTPGAAYQQEQQDQAIKRAVDQIRKDMEARVPVTPPESAGWMNRMLAEIWEPFVVPQVLKDNLSAWQEKVRATAPSGWDIDLVDMSLGREGPTLSNYQVFNNSSTGRMMVMECDMLMDSSSMRVVVRGSGPLGSFTASVTGVTMKGRMRIQPIPEQRMILWSYTEPPDATVRLQVRGPLIGERDVPQFSFIKSAFNAAIQDSLVEPRRAAVSLDYEYLVQQAVDTYINVYVESIDGLLAAPPAPPARPALDDTSSSSSTSGKAAQKQLASSTGSASSSATVAASATVVKQSTPGVEVKQASGAGAGSKPGRGPGGSSSALVSKPPSKASSAASTSSLAALRRRPAVLVTVVNLDTKLQRRSATRLVSPDGRVSLNELIKLELGGKEGIIEVQVRDASRARQLLGRALVHIMASKDGCTLIWALGRNREPQALRWQPAMGPWRLTLPLEGCASEDATITLGLSADPWTYSVPQLPAVAYKTPGPRTIVMQIMEGKELAAKDWAGTSDPYVQVNYSGSTVRTRTIYNSLRPVWGETFVLAENPSLLTRRVRLSVWDSGVSRDDSLGSTSISLDLAVENAIQDRWIQLSSEDSGEVRIRLAIVPGTTDAPAVTQMVALLSSNYTSASMSTLQVVVVGARGLMPRPAALNLLGSERNAYASISYAGARQVTSVIPNSTSPTWNHSSLFPLDLSQAQKPPSPPYPTAPPMASTAPDTTPATNSMITSNVHAPNWNTNTATNPLMGGISRGAGSLRNWPYPATVSTPATRSTDGPPATRPAPLPSKRSPPAHVPSTLRIEVRDVDVVPPDGDLGYAELDVSQVVPVPGSVWEQWLPLREGGSGEVLIRLAHISPSAAAQGALPLPPGSIQVPQSVATPAGGVPAAGSKAATEVASGTGQAKDAPGKGTATRMEQQVIDNLTVQARGVGEVAQAAVQQAGDLRERLTQQAGDLRVKLGQDWIPKVQGWWKGVSIQAQSSWSSSLAAVIPTQSSPGNSDAAKQAQAQQGSPPVSAEAAASSSGQEGSTGSSASPPVAGTATGATGGKQDAGADGGGGNGGGSAGGAAAAGTSAGEAGGASGPEAADPALGPDVFTPWQPSRAASPASTPVGSGTNDARAGESGNAALSWIGTLLTTTWPPSTASYSYESEDESAVTGRGRKNRQAAVKPGGSPGGTSRMDVSGGFKTDQRKLDVQEADVEVVAEDSPGPTITGSGARDASKPASRN